MAGDNPLLERLGEDFFRSIPPRPGVYFLLGAQRDVLYVGKADDLRARLRSYTRINRSVDHPRRDRLARACHAICWEEHSSGAAAVRRETLLLRALRPPYNVTHSLPADHLGVGVRQRGQTWHARVTSGPADSGETFRAYPFDAATPHAAVALTRTLAGVSPHPMSRRKATLRSVPASGVGLVVAEPVAREVDSFLSGRRKKLLATLAAAQPAGEDLSSVLARRRFASDLVVLEEFFRRGPHWVRALQVRYGDSRRRAVDGAELDRLIAAEVMATHGVVVRDDRTLVHAHVAELRDQGLGLAAIAKRLNALRVPRTRGTGVWRAADVAEVVAEVAPPNLRLRSGRAGT